MTDEVAQRLEAFIREHFQVPEDDDAFTRDVNLWEEGYVDSRGIVELIAYLEDSFSITVAEDMLFSPEFTSIDGIAACVARLQSS